MFSVQQAFDTILSLVSPPSISTDRESIGLQGSLGRILAADILAPWDFPPSDNSAMDGYAVGSGDITAASPDHPVRLALVGEIPAEAVPNFCLEPGQAARIFTGGTLPQGADAIVMQENTQREGNEVLILSPEAQGTFVRCQGSYCGKGAPLLHQGTQIGAPEMAILAAAQCLTVPLWRQPRVGILSTGSELIPPEAPLAPGKIIDSNQVALGAFVVESGGIPHPLGIVSDHPDVLQAKIVAALDHVDLLLTTGGASVGAYDYVETVLANLNATIALRSVAVKPGKPLTVATFPGKKPLLIGLPGNPASALVGCWRFVYFALQKMAGLPETNWQPTFLKCFTDQLLQGNKKRESYVWGKLKIQEEKLQFVQAPGSQNSGNLIGLAHTTALAIVPQGVEEIPAGAPVMVLPLGKLTCSSEKGSIPLPTPTYT